MKSTAAEVLEFVRENDIKFIRLGFCDIFGMQKNISIMAEELQAAFDTGVAFETHAIRGFRDETNSDLLLFPDPATLMLLPWRPGPGRVARFYCDVKTPSGDAFPHDGRALLKRIVERCESAGHICRIGAECEFFLFKTNENGEPTGVPLDRGGYLDISPLDKGENIRREICLTLEEMGITPESSHHEQGPGQNEIDFKSGDALACADNLQTLKSVVKAIAERNGVFASFMPKPLVDAAGSGMHINISLAQNGLTDKEPSALTESFIAGVLAKTPEMTLFLNPLANSYERFGEFKAPGYVTWSHQNLSQLMRVSGRIGREARMELRSPDPSANPYIAFALIIAAGLLGIKEKLALPPALDADLLSADESVIQTLTPLPDSLENAIALAAASGFVRSALGEGLLTKFIALKKAEAADFFASEDRVRFYKERYFDST